MSEKTRENPRISVNKLGEYLTASPIRRRSIVKDQKHPPDFKAARYAPARRGIVNWFVAGGDDAAALGAFGALSLVKPETDWQQQDKDLSLLALERFLEIEGIPVLAAIDVDAGPNDPKKLLQSGVEVSVRPDLVLRGTDKQGRRFIGAVKVHFSKDGPLDDTAGAAVATVVHQYVDEVLRAEDEVAALAYCIVVDVFSGRVFPAPRSVARKRALIAAALEEVALWWPTV